MRILALILMGLFLMACQTLKQDVGTAPSSLNQMRLVMSTNGKVNVGMATITEPNSELKFKVFGAGVYNVRGFGACSGHSDGSFSKKVSWVNLDYGQFQSGEICLLSIEVKHNNFDSNVSGIVLIQMSNNPDILPLAMKHDDTNGLGAMALQMAEDYDRKTLSIPEGRFLEFYPKATKGTIKFSSSCKNKDGQFAYYEQDYNSSPFKVSLDSLYSQLDGIKTSCMFSALINPDESMKEGATVYVGVYKQFGSWLPTPSVSKNIEGKTCFKFLDEYAVGSCVGDNCKFSSHICADDGVVTVMGVTSKLRLFYGVYDISSSKWEVIK